MDDQAVDRELPVEWSNAYLALSRGGASADLGLQTVTLGKGLIMTDDVPAAALNFNLGKAYMALTLAQALDSSPMAAATLGIRPGEYEHAALFGIWFQDQDNAFARAIPLIYQVLLEPESEGELYWAGISLDLFVGKALLSVVGAYQWGQFRLYNNALGVDRNVSAFLADLYLGGNLSDWSSLGVFVLFAQGDDTPLRGDLNAFISVMPFNSRAAIFLIPNFWVGTKMPRT